MRIRRKQRTFIALTLTASMLLSMGATALTEIEVERVNRGESLRNIAELEPRVYSTATLDDDFCGKSVLVVMDRSYSRINRVHEASFFGDFAIEEVRDLSIVYNETMLRPDDYRPVPTASNRAQIEHSVAIIAREEAMYAAEAARADANGIDIVEEFSRSEHWQIDRANFRQILQIRLPVDCKENVLRVIRQLEQVDGVMSASPNLFHSPDTTNPNDTHYRNGNQWGLMRVSASGAWNLSVGSTNASFRIGVIDSGIAVHSDLDANVERVMGWDFVNGNNVTTDDPSWHGTNVAGIIGGRGNNGIGITGVCQVARLVPLQVVEGVDLFLTASVAAAIDYARNHRIPILNYSGSGSVSCPTLRRAILDYPGLFVTTAGNSGTNNDVAPRYPANHNLSNMIVVGNSGFNNNDIRCSSSNHSSTRVHLFAPGVGIITTGRSGSFVYEGGTSMAAPLVAGTAALMLTVRPNATTAQLRSHILSSVDARPPLSMLCSTGGRLNTNLAVRSIRSI
jgi:subtilisin family serine protease